mmetsp:Transcript_6429/g.22967  ORF Transcript_6429/g.22967 Transcript_6429/m.22967 type:complete len:227 (-) Transcript_6429:1561-2241(-)
MLSCVLPRRLQAVLEGAADLLGALNIRAEHLQGPIKDGRREVQELHHHLLVIHVLVYALQLFQQSQGLRLTRGRRAVEHGLQWRQYRLNYHLKCSLLLLPTHGHGNKDGALKNLDDILRLKGAQASRHNSAVDGENLLFECPKDPAARVADMLESNRGSPSSLPVFQGGRNKGKQGGQQGGVWKCALLHPSRDPAGVCPNCCTRRVPELCMPRKSWDCGEQVVHEG